LKMIKVGFFFLIIWDKKKLFFSLHFGTEGIVK
jgi:hypothetical protein